MLFNSISFYFFFLIILILRFVPSSWRFKKGALLAGSYIFYAAWNPPFIILLWLSTAVDWFLAKKIEQIDSNLKTRRRIFLLISLVLNLGLLGYFKYGSFLLDNFIEAMHLLGIEFTPSPVSIVLPVGISFYTFQSLSYTLDVYFKRIKTSHSFLDFALYIAFFPQLVAGPIVRSEEFLPQCESEKKPSSGTFGWGLFLLTFGLFQKAFLADLIFAPVAEELFSSQVTLNAMNAWTGVLAFSMQILLDFSGYTNCAIGAALALGFILPENFKFPYAAIGFSDFWRRWHISLSSWLRDYLYIPLGGNRSGSVSTAVNIMITMLIGGLWHGASWNFVIWGGLHGFYLVLERYLRTLSIPGVDFNKKTMQIVLSLATFTVVSLTWVFFRSPDLSLSVDIISSLFNFSFKGDNLKPFQVVGIWIITLLFLKRQWRLRNSSIQEDFLKYSRVKIAMLWIVMLVVMIYIRGGEGNAFIYFQF